MTSQQQIQKRVSLVGVILAVSGAIFFSTKAIIVKLAFNQTKIDAVSLLTLRMLFSLPFYIGAAWILGSRKNNVRMSARQWLYIVLLGLFGYYLSSLFDFLGLQYISAGLERLILFLYPTLSVLINAAAFKEKISRQQSFALILTYLGILLAYLGEMKMDHANPHFFLGSFLIFLCAITFATYISGSGRMIPMVGATKFTAYVMLSSTAGVFTHFLLNGNYEIFRQSEHFIWYGLSLALVATVIPSFLVSLGMKRIGSNNVAIISSIGPVSTILQANIFLGEPIFAAQIAGTILVITGVMLIGWRQRKSTLQKAAE